MRRLAPAALLSILAAPALARADPPPLRIDYRAAPGCPGEGVFLDEILWRSSVARLAAPGDRGALAVEARLTRQGALHRGRLSLGRGRERITREIQGESCDEVVSALALITALAVDPKASTARERPLAAPPPAPAAPLPGAGSTPATGPRRPPPFAASPLFAPPDLVADPLPVLPSPPGNSPAPRRWIAGARFSTAFAVTPRPLFGGGLFAERALGSVASLRLGLDLAGTGSFTAGPGGVSFLRVAGRVEGCVFPLRIAARVSLVPCIGVEGGVLHGEGATGGSILRAQQATVPWAGAGLLPRLAADLGAVTLDLQAGPVFPLVRRSFVFERPAYVIHDLPAATWMVALGAGLPFP